MFVKMMNHCYFTYEILYGESHTEIVVMVLKLLLFKPTNAHNFIKITIIF